MNDDQTDCIRRATERIEASERPIEMAILIGEHIDGDLVASIEIDQDIKTWSIAAIYTYIDALTVAAGIVEVCPCMTCRGYQDKIAQIRQIIKPN